MNFSQKCWHIRFAFEQVEFSLSKENRLEREPLKAWQLAVWGRKARRDEEAGTLLLALWAKRSGFETFRLQNGRFEV